jgi:hypothetical protein
MVKIVIDPESLSLANHFALVRSPRRNRKRFAESCVMVTPDEHTAREQANADKNLHPAIVYGPSVSSESQRIYYLVKWL